ncbi:calmodulin-related [Lithospermum erythrorhizon]|uniref:Calmodulin-related n=1 Tax=Lithospermum erythrorhizon TaxID=34254 RepID=A0AAV3NKW1_LITER
MDTIELSRLFEVFDRNGDGRITKKELKKSLENMGIFIQERELDQMIEKIDVNGDGCVDIAEFGSLYKSIMENPERKVEGDEDMKEAFNVFDQNGDGFISVEELRAVLGSLGLKQGMDIADCRKMIMKIDADGNGMVDYNEFKKMMRRDGFAAFT